MSETARRAVVLHDPRPFLVQAIDHALTTGVLTTVDLDLLTTDLEVLAFKYHARRRWDLRDLHSVAAAAEIVCMYADDGLQLLSKRDLATATAILRDDGVLPCFRAGFGTMERLRMDRDAYERDATLTLGPPGGTLVFAVSVPDARDDMRTELTDDALVERFRRGVPLRTARMALQSYVDHVHAWLAIARALPTGEVTTAWRNLLNVEEYHIEPEERRDAFERLTIGMVIAMAVERELHVVVRAATLQTFLSTCVVREGVRWVVRPKILEATTSRLCDALLPVIGMVYRSALLESIQLAIGALHTSWNTEPGAAVALHPDVPGFWTLWSNLLFLEVDSTTRARALDDDVAMVGDSGALAVRFEIAEDRDVGVRLLDALHLDRASVRKAVHLLEAKPEYAEVIVNRIGITRRSPRDLAALLDAAASDGAAARTVARAIVASRASLRGLPASVIEDLAAAAAPLDRTARAQVLARWGATGLRCIRAYRDAPNRERRRTWILLTTAVPELFAALLGDALPGEREEIADALGPGSARRAGDGIEPEAVAACVAYVEAAARRRFRRRVVTLSHYSGTPAFMDDDLRWLWPRLAREHQEAVQEVLAHGRLPRPPTRRAKRRTSKRNA